MSDPLARFQKAQSIAHELSDQKEKSSKHILPIYHAFAMMEKLDKSDHLQIRRLKAASHAPAYSHLLDLYYDGIHGTGVVLMYSFMHVKVKGKNLQAMIDAIQKHECLYIQEFDAHAFHPPKSEDAVIDSIEVITKGGEL